MTRTSSFVALAIVALTGGCEHQPAKAPVAAAHPAAAAQDPSRAMVTVFIDGMDVDWQAPWGTGKSWARTDAGLVVDGQRILVVGWALRNQQHVAVQKQGASTRVPASVLVFDEDAGLALLTVGDPTFWRDTQPAQIAARLPAVGAVKIWHPSGDGTRLDASPGSVAGFLASGPFNFVHAKIAQVDAEHIGGSDFVTTGTDVVGAVMSTANKEVMAVGAPTLRDFLSQASLQPYRGYAQLAVSWQRLSNSALHDYLGLRADEGGVRIERVFPNGSAAGVLEVGDVLLAVGDAKVDRDGTYQNPQAGRIAFTALFSDGKHAGDVVALSVMRAGARKTVSLALKPFSYDDDLIPAFTPRAGPPYVVHGGLLFETLSREYLQSTFGKEWEMHAPPQLLVPWELARWSPTPDRPRLIVLTRVLPLPATLGYEQLRNLVVDGINGTSVRNLDDVNQAFSHPQGAFHVITLAPGQGMRRIVLDVQEAKDADARGLQ